MKNKKSVGWLPYVMVFPAFAVMTLVVIFPICNTVLKSFTTASNSFTLDNYLYFFTSRDAVESLVFTMAEALCTMIFGITFSFLLALYLRFSKAESAGSWEGYIFCHVLFRELQPYMR